MDSEDLDTTTFPSFAAWKEAIRHPIDVFGMRTSNGRPKEEASVTAGVSPPFLHHLFQTQNFSLLGEYFHQ
jgi:hypothetical protein